MEEKEIEAYELIKDATIEEIAESLLAFSEIGTIEECREAVARQKPVKPIKTTSCETGRSSGFICPRCGSFISEKGMWPVCYNCGQAIDWSEEAD